MNKKDFDFLTANVVKIPSYSHGVCVQLSEMEKLVKGYGPNKLSVNQATELYKKAYPSHIMMIPDDALKFMRLVEKHYGIE